MNATVHRIERVRTAGKYCEIWVSPSLREGWDLAPKWDELAAAVDAAALYEDVLNHGYIGLRIVIEPGPHETIRIVALSSRKHEGR